MKKVLIIMFVLMPLCGLLAQPQGRKPGAGGPPPRGGMREGGLSQKDVKPVLEYFPEIPGLTLEQREKVGSILTKEREDMEKEMEKKHEIEKSIREGTGKDKHKKLYAKMQKCENKIESIKKKSDKKIKKILSDEQYLVFVEKRNEFKFMQQQPKRLPVMEEGNGRPSFGNRQ